MDYYETGIAEHSERVCLLCHEPIVELKKAQWLPVGLGLRLVAHDTCMEALLDTAREAEQEEREAWEAVDYFTSELRKAQQDGIEPMRKHF